MFPAAREMDAAHHVPMLRTFSLMSWIPHNIADALVESEASLELKRKTARAYVAGLGIGKVRRIVANGQAGSARTEPK